MADIILPTAVWVENESRFYQVSNKFIYQPKLVDPPGETKSATWIYLQLAKKLGFGDKYSSVLASIPVTTTWPDAAWDSAWESLNKTAYNTWAALADVKALNPPSWDDFLKTKVFTFPVATLAHAPKTPFSAQIQTGTAFPDNDYHKSGKIEIYSNWLATTDMTTTWYGGPIAPMPEWVPVWQSFWTQDEFKKYPLLVTTAHAQHRMHNWTDGNPLLGDVTNELRDPIHSGDMYGAKLYISPVDADARGLVEGDMVRAYNSAGQIVVKAVISPWLTPGNVHLPEGRWANFIGDVDRRGNANTITYADRMNPSCSFPHMTICEVERF
jgi:anaerobic selenocysteine-containing dehydrogenase